MKWLRKAYYIVKIIDVFQKQKGSQSDPCGTPYLGLCMSESKPFIEINCILFDKQEENQLLARSLIP